MLHLDVLGPTGPYRSRKQKTIHDVTGTPVASLSLAPRVYVTRALHAMRQTETLPTDERVTAIARAGTAFATATVAGLSAEEYQRTVSAVSGMPIATVRSATAAIAHAADRADHSAQQARPLGAVTDWHDPLTRTGRAVWIRRGEVFAVHAAGNHPAVHQAWLDALALGYRVAVRPSRREPFTPYRLVTALRDAGFRDDQVVLLPTDHDAADEIVRQADRSLVYGGDDVMRKYADHPTVLPQGPGRSKILLTADTDWTLALDTIIDSISSGGGVGCVNATAVLVEGDPAPVAEAIAARLAQLPSLPPHDERAILPVFSTEAARLLETHLQARAEGTTSVLGGNGNVDELGDGSAVLRPSVHQVDSPFSDQIGVELGFPCVWIAPWSRDAGIAPLRGTLVLTAITTDEQMLDDLVAEPTISNVHIGHHPTSWMEPGLPHDGYLGEFLMRSKTVLR
ncbi:aldehyde dehydrogenase family protein [Streptomyces sp. NPDC057199]|uniref:aldehyde dehydrogenase family protein n=1 Tax=Streptomyces sp. NPDC057199 TaxID=3346047 RepID=UPI003632CE2A